MKKLLASILKAALIAGIGLSTVACTSSQSGTAGVTSQPDTSLLTVQSDISPDSLFNFVDIEEKHTAIARYSGSPLTLTYYLGKLGNGSAIIWIAGHSEFMYLDEVPNDKKAPSCISVLYAAENYDYSLDEFEELSLTD